MAMRSRTTLKKRQKELARLERARDKAARRLQRKLDKQAGVTEPDESVEPLDEAAASGDAAADTASHGEE